MIRSITSIWVVFWLLLTVGCGNQERIQEATVRATIQTHNARFVSTLHSERAYVNGAIEGTRNNLLAALYSFELYGEPAFRAACEGFFSREEYRNAILYAQKAQKAGHNLIFFDYIIADSLIGLGEFQNARNKLAIMLDFWNRPKPVLERLQQALLEDPKFLGPSEQITTQGAITSIRPLGGGSTITLKFKEGKKTVAAFKPNQSRLQSNYRAEIAAYRLSKLLKTGFVIPYSKEIKIALSDFLVLYGIPSLNNRLGYSSGFADLIWTDEENDKFLYGVWKYWVPHFTRFPIEYYDIWQPWVTANANTDPLQLSLEISLRPLKFRPRGYYRNILKESGHTNTYGLARQISNIIVFDFLINNWDRFSKEYYGVNCQWANGHFVSIDNGAGFSVHDPSRPRSRLRLITRFSRGMIRNIRNLDKDTITAVLFPNTTKKEHARIKAFWERRTELLKYVDKQIEKWGEHKVLYFD